MFVKTNYYFLVRSFLSTLSVLSLLVLPAITLAHPSFGNQCSSCHASTDTGLVEEDPTEFATEENTTTLTTEMDLTEPTSTIEENTLTLPTETEVVESTSAENSTELTTVPSSNNVAQFTTQFDLNGDGQVTQDELQALQSEFFDSADINADGFLTNEELQAAKETQAIQLISNNKFGCGLNFNRLDNNQDGLISKEEFVNNVPMFDQFDLDNNGIIVAKELILKKPHQHWMAHKNHYNNWINDKSYNGVGYGKNGNFGKH